MWLTYPDGSTDTLTVPVDPAIAAVLTRYPMPNIRPARMERERTLRRRMWLTNADQFSIRIDQQFGAKDHFLRDSITTI